MNKSTIDADYTVVGDNIIKTSVSIKKALFFIFIIAFALSGMFFLNGGQAENKSGLSTPPLIDKAILPENDTQTTAYQKQISEVNENEAIFAATEGVNSLPIASGGLNEKIIPNPQTTYNEISTPQKPSLSLSIDNLNTDPNLVQQKSDMMQVLLGQWAPSRSTTVENNSTTPNPSIQQTKKAEILNQIPTPTTKSELILQAGEILYGETINEANSDVPGALIVDLLGSKFGKARLIGSFERKEGYLDVRFTQMALPTGDTVPISAIALNIRNSSSALRTSINRRLLQRYGLPALANFLQGFGQAAARPNNITSIGNGGSVTVQENNSTTKEQIFSGAAVSAGILSQDLSAIAQTIQPLVKLSRGTGLGILFLKDVEK